MNYGTRIDLILAAGLSMGPPPAQLAPAAAAPASVEGAAAGGCGAASMNGSSSVYVVGGDIWPEHQGSDHCPVWADIACAGGARFPCSPTGEPPPLPACMQ